MFSEKRSNVLHGILLIALFSCSAFYIAEFPFVKNLSFSPLIVGIILGMIYANSLRNHLPETWVPGILFCTKQVLRAGIVLYGFRLTFQSVVAIGLPAILIDTIIVTATIFIGLFVGRLMKMDRDLALLTSTGSAICGAAAVLGAEPVVKSEPHKTAVAVSTVVIFGTLSMFIYPAMYRSGILDLTPEQMGLYTGSTLHEVAHVVGAGNAMGKEISDTAIIVKMIRVMMLAPVLVIMSLALARTAVKAVSNGVKGAGVAKRGKITIPWFAFGFLAVIGFNSFDLLPHAVVDGINNVDTFMLTMAMTALGAETSIEKFKKAGAKPFILAAVLYIWLLGGGYLLAKYLV
ncbi:YeiH family putative sulfate export transporter [Parabacteroides acidifaciens]|uniref:YeiH family protein n=1 Tax=Parabacteroides acidifaciens TaxID=2290935 RepID=A0A3D8HFU3_9BACT|nr:YeiH family protein [Parabacteroides acidifaciens]MBC8601632.1 YeiH family putative sulfate export transporter [Parabacteroides acidifaciens]RDU49620.1 YeiH family protein [Parabacteroides acidifaciens]